MNSGYRLVQRKINGYGNVKDQYVPLDRPRPEGFMLDSEHRWSIGGKEFVTKYYRRADETILVEIYRRLI